MEFQKELLQHKSDLKAGALLLDFFKEVDQKVESYIDTLEIMDNPELLKSIRRGLRGKGMKLDEFKKKHGFA